MGYYQVEIFVAGAVFGGVAPCYGALVERMPCGDARHDGRTGYARHVFEFVHHAGVGGECAAAGDTLGEVVGYAASEVAGVVAHRVFDFTEHLPVDFVDSAFDGFQ